MIANLKGFVSALRASEIVPSTRRLLNGRQPKEQRLDAALREHSFCRAHKKGPTPPVVCTAGPNLLESSPGFEPSGSV